MKKTWMILALTALGSSSVLACGDDEHDEPRPGNGGDGGAKGDDDGDDDGMSEDGQGGMTGEGAGDVGGASGKPSADRCSNDVADAGVSLGGGGGAGGPACEPPAEPQEEISIVGDYQDGYGYPQSITAGVWDTGWSRFHLSLVDNEAGYALALNDAENTYHPCLWSRFVWTRRDGRLYYCQAPYAASSECGAEERELPDDSDLEQGCDGFAWSELIEN